MDDERPAKRPRTEMRRPDGFDISKPSLRRPIPVPQFISAFDAPAPAASSSSSTKSRKSASISALGTRLAAAAHSRPLNSTGHTAPEMPRFDFGETKEKPKPKLMRLKPPVFASIAGPSGQRPSNGGRPAQSNTSLRDVLPAPAPPPQPNRTWKAPGVPKFIIPGPKVSPKPLVPLSALPKPVFPQAKKKPIPANYVKITETRIAKMTDIHTQNGLSELLSLYLQQHGTGYIDPLESEMKRGLEQSPEKRAKNKDMRFLRGGLAEAASRRLSGTRSNNMLWELENDGWFEKGRRPKPDLRLRIMNVLYSSPPPNTKPPRISHAPRVVLARCDVLSSRLPHEVMAGMELLILFRVTENQRMKSDPMFRARKTVAEGSEVYLWRPWDKVAVPTVQVSGAVGYGSALGPGDMNLAVQICFSLLQEQVPGVLLSVKALARGLREFYAPSVFASGVSCASTVDDLFCNALPVYHIFVTSSTLVTVIPGFNQELEMPRAHNSKASLSQGDDDNTFMAAVAQQVQTTLEKKKKENESRLLQMAKVDLEKCGSPRTEEFADIVEEMKVIYEQFAMDYAKAEDNIRAKWQRLLIMQDKCLEFSKDKYTIVQDADNTREKGQVRGMAIAKKAVEDCGTLISSLTEPQIE